MTTINNPSYHPGLDGVIAGVTSICQVDEEKGGLFYRGYAIEELARRSSFEEVLYLLLLGKLPTLKEFSEWKKRLIEERHLPTAVQRAIQTFPETAHPLDKLRSAVSILSLYDRDVSDNSREANLKKGIRLASQVPLLIGSLYRHSQNQAILKPDPSLSIAGNLIYLIRGVPPDEIETKGMDGSLILYAEHEFNASTFAARVTASTLSDFHSAVVSAIGTLKGPLHGGANEGVMNMLLEIKEIDRCETWLNNALGQKRKIPGFGHRIYKKGDSRSPIIEELSRRLSEETGNSKWYKMSKIIEGFMKEKKNLYPNLDFYSATAYYQMNLPVSLYTSLFVASRISGWGAHIMEQYDQNTLIRPRSLYQGQVQLKYTSLERR